MKQGRLFLLMLLLASAAQAQHHHHHHHRHHRLRTTVVSQLQEDELIGWSEGDKVEEEQQHPTYNNNNKNDLSMWEWEAQFDEQVQESNEYYETSTTYHKEEGVILPRSLLKLQETLKKKKRPVRFALLPLTLGDNAKLAWRGCRAAASRLLEESHGSIETICDMYGSAITEAVTKDHMEMQAHYLTQFILAAEKNKNKTNNDHNLDDSEDDEGDTAVMIEIDPTTALFDPRSATTTLLSSLLPPANGTNSSSSISTTATSTRTANMLYDGIAIAVTVPKVIGPLIDRAVEAGIPVVTYDSDAPESKRHMFIATNQTFLGVQLAKVVKQLEPEGGSFATIWADVGTAILERTVAFRNYLVNITNIDDTNKKKTRWTEVPNSPVAVRNLSHAMAWMERFANQTEAPPTAIAIMVNPAFNARKYEVIVDKYRHLNITWVGVGDTARQMDLLRRNYVHGLTGNLPYDWGYFAAQRLHRMLAGEPFEQEMKATNVITHIQIPVELPELVVDHNRVGQLAIVGYVFFAITFLTATGLMCWVWFHRTERVVQTSQPVFLLMVAFGILIMSSGILPLGLDDSHSDTEAHRIAICMSPLWLFCTGFTVAFSALFSKTSKVNKLFKAGLSITRITVSNTHVLLQCLVLLGLNWIVLICFTVLDPLTYVRLDNPGTDGWNRVLSTSGQCQAGHEAIYWVPLVFINMLCLGIANWQAYQARHINIEFSEGRYIGMTCISMLQTGLVGIPIMFVVQDYPEAFYLVIVSVVFVVSMAVLLLIFVPKIVLNDSYSRHSAEIQDSMLQNVIRETVKSQKRQRQDASTDAEVPMHRASAPAKLFDGSSGLETIDSSGTSFNPHNSFHNN